MFEADIGHLHESTMALVKDVSGRDLVLAWNYLHPKLRLGTPPAACYQCHMDLCICEKKEFEVLVFASRFLFRGAGHFMNACRPEAEIPSMHCRGAPKY